MSSFRKTKDANRGSKPTFDKGTFKRILSYVLNGHKLQFFAALVCVLISSLVSVASSIFLKTLIDDIIGNIDKLNPNYTELIRYICYMASIFIVGILASLFQALLMNKMSQSILKEIREDLFSHMEKLPLRFYDSHNHGEIMSYYTNDIDSLDQLYSQSLVQFVSTVFTVVSVFIAMCVLSLIMTLIVVVTVILMYIALIKVSKQSGKYFKLNQEGIAKIDGYIEEMMNGQKVIKVFNHEQATMDKFDSINEDWYVTNYKAHKYSNILMPIMGNLTNLQYVIVAVLGGIMAMNNVPGITLGMIASFLQLSRSFSQPISRFAQQINMIVMGLAAGDRIFKLLDQPVEENEGKVKLVNVKIENDKLIETEESTNHWAFKVPVKEDEFKLVELKGDVRINNVNFAYDEKDVLHDINIFAKPGQKIAFVGATGAGKTTITNLLTRFYDIKKGTITYDGIDIKDIDKKSLRRSLGMVLQDTNLFTGTILENLKYGNPDATMDEVIEACKLANAHHFIERLPEGYNTLLTNNGSGLSQGQRQLLSIARCALSNPPVMILDEATSSIDTRTEKIVQDGMDKLMKGRTVFVIAHRLSTVKNSKAIMVMDHGRIIERGNHEDLINQKGTYYQLYTGKFELE